MLGDHDDLYCPKCDPYPCNCYPSVAWNSIWRELDWCDGDVPEYVPVWYIRGMDLPIMSTVSDPKLPKYGKLCEGCLPGNCNVCFVKDGRPTCWDNIPF